MTESSAHLPDGQLDMFDALSMDSDSQFVLSLISTHVGRSSAISVATITRQTGIPERTVRDIVKNLIERHHVRIGSALGHPSGYYIINTIAEADENERTLRRLGISILKRASTLKGLTVDAYLKTIRTDLL